MLTTKMVDELLMTIKTEATKFSDQASTGQPCGDAISINLDRKFQQRSSENTKKKLRFLLQFWPFTSYKYL